MPAGRAAATRGSEEPRVPAVLAASLVALRLDLGQPQLLLRAPGRGLQLA